MPGNKTLAVTILHLIGVAGSALFDREDCFSIVRVFCLQFGGVTREYAAACMISGAVVPFARRYVLLCSLWPRKIAASTSFVGVEKIAASLMGKCEQAGSRSRQGKAPVSCKDVHITQNSDMASFQFSPENTNGCDKVKASGMVTKGGDKDLDLQIKATR
jgi:hypothetical protein